MRCDYIQFAIAALQMQLMLLHAAAHDEKSSKSH